jgi:hypothetical protein
MNENLDALVVKARNIKMTPEQEREQRLSFAYGNTKLANPDITGQMVAEADLKVSTEEQSFSNS